MQNISLWSSACAESPKFWGFKSNTATLTFSFRFLSSLFFRFSCLILFFFCWAFSRLHFGEKNFRKAFRILGLFERKGRWVWNKIVMAIFRSTLHGFLQIFSSVVHRIVIILAGCKENQFYILAFTSPDVISTSPQKLLTGIIDFTVLLLFAFLKRHHLPIGQVKNRIH